MKWYFKYNENKPDYKSYNNLLVRLEKKANIFFELNNIFKEPYNYDIILKYEKEKKKLVYEMFDDIIKCFSNMHDIPCSIYLNGSYGRNSITANSDLDLTLYFKKNDIEKYQTLVYLIRYAISKMFNLNIVHVHSFTKNFTTKYRKENNLVELDQELETIIEWEESKEKISIQYPNNQMIPEREICEITSIKCIEDLITLMNNKLTNYNPKEWMYTHECIYKTNDSFDMNKIIKKLDSIYEDEIIKEKLKLIKTEIKKLESEIKIYYRKLKNNNNIVLADFDIIGKRKVFLLINTLFVYIRWYYILNKKSVSETLDINAMLNNYNELIDKDFLIVLKDNYYYYKYIISRVEIWTTKYNHHFEHRSKEIILKELFIEEYYNLWKNDYNPIEEQINIFNKMDVVINNILNECEKSMGL